ncbi:MAG: alginate export family protein, partial [bacterium]
MDACKKCFIAVIVFMFVLFIPFAVGYDRDPLIEVLIEKGILTEDEAREIEEEVARREAQREAERRETAPPVAIHPPTERALPAPPPFKISGQFRIRSEARNDSDFNSTAQDHTDFTGQRIRLNLDGRTSPARYFVQLQHSRNWGEELLTASSPIASSDVDLHQGFIEYGRKNTLRIGRQEIILGSERLVGAFGWSNNGRAYDGLRLEMPLNQSSFDVFAVKVMENTATKSDDTNLYGISYTCNKKPNVKPVAYVLFKHVDDDSGTPKSNVLVTGSLTTIQMNPRLTLDWEAAIESGNAAGADLNAYAYHIGAKYNAIPDKFWLGAEYNMATGDGDPTDNKVKTFDQLYPTNHNKYGYIDY